MPQSAEKQNTLSPCCPPRRTGRTPCSPAAVAARVQAAVDTRCILHASGLGRHVKGLIGAFDLFLLQLGSGELQTRPVLIRIPEGRNVPFARSPDRLQPPGLSCHFVHLLKGDEMHSSGNVNLD